jgi:D-alanyl-D-alanine carboxypeptidase/D-alanyl-D-alanine-endopeptidase (penicillin-binding protein 4)
MTSDIMPRSVLFHVILLLLTTVLCSCAKPSPKKWPPTTPQITTKLETLLDTPALAQSTVGLHIVNLGTGETVFSHNAGKLFHPASTTKLFTSAVVLHYLGAEYRFATRVATTQPAQSHIAKLYLIGSGDPSLVTEDLTDLARQIHAMGIRYIDTIICDATLFDAVQYGNGWMWDDQPYKDFAPICALSVNRNVVEIQITPQKNGQPVENRVHPQTGFINIHNFAVSRGRNGVLSVTRDLQNGQNTITISGNLGRQQGTKTILRNIEQPALYAGTLLMEECQKRGIEVTNPPIHGQTPENTETIALHQSLPMHALLTEMNKDSVNIYAELLLKTAAWQQTSAQGTTDAGLLLMNELLEEWNISTKTYSFADGSGISRYNLVTPETLTSLLQHVYSSATADTFINSLPIGGYDGDLDWRMEPLSEKQNVHAKTGYLRGVSTLAGFINTDSGDTLAFTIMVQHFNGSAAPILEFQDKVCEQLSEL